MVAGRHGPLGCTRPDQCDGQGLGAQGHPTIFLNVSTPEDLRDAIEEALG